MELIRKDQIEVFQNSGVESLQLIYPENSDSHRVTITKVVIAVGATNPPHRHNSSEQIWVALSGNGTLLLDEGRSIPFSEGDVVRFVDGELHGINNTGSEVFVYLSVTSPPQNFRDTYQHRWFEDDNGDI